MGVLHLFSNKTFETHLCACGDTQCVSQTVMVLRLEERGSATTEVELANFSNLFLEEIGF